MTHKQRALAAMRGEPTGRIPFIARMELWFNYHHVMGTLPEPYRTASLYEMQRDLDIGIFGFGAWGLCFYKLEQRRVEVRKWSDAGANLVEYVTPHGTLRTRHVLAEELKAADVQGMQMEYPFKGPSDYDALLFMLEDMQVVENFDEYGAFVEEIGEDGVALPFSNYLPMHQVAHRYMGYETFYYELHDRPAQVERVHEVLLEQYRQAMKLACQCPADALEVGGNYDESMTPPPFFEQYCTPLYREIAEQFRKAGKILVVHGDGEMKRLLPMLRDADVQVVEALTPAPMTSIDVRQVRAMWKDRVAVWGGVPAIVMTDTFSDDEFEEYMRGLFDAVAPGDRFILGLGDNVPTDGKFERILRLAEMSKGAFPKSPSCLS